MRRLVLIPILIVGGMLLSACETDPPGDTWQDSPIPLLYDRPVALPPEVAVGFYNQYPGSRIAFWDRKVSVDGNEFYDIRYYNAEGETRQVHLSPTGETVAPPTLLEPDIPQQPLEPQLYEFNEFNEPQPDPE